MNLGSIFGTWSDAAHAALSAVVTYTALVVFVRVTGKRAVAKWNAFDLIVTVALGSTLATTVVSGNVTIMTGLGALSVLLALQFGITWASVRSHRIHRAVKSNPALLVRDGRLRHDTMRRERVRSAKPTVQVAARTAPLKLH